MVFGLTIDYRISRFFFSNNEQVLVAIGVSDLMIFDCTSKSSSLLFTYKLSENGEWTASVSNNCKVLALYLDGSSQMTIVKKNFR
jgi:hypothetical protein